ncbi:N-acetyltransferase [Paenibacillus marinisediminis]
MQTRCRKATEDDIESLFKLIQNYAEQSIMLPRTREMLLDQLEHFIVAEQDGQLIGCGSLCHLGSDLVEIRSLGISPEYKGQGIGTLIIDELLELARERKVPRLMALTYAVGFFEKNGFEVVEKEIFPEKVWKDCVYCNKRHACDEIAVLKVLN